MKRHFQENVDSFEIENEYRKMFNNLSYDFKKFELDALAKKIRSQAMYKPRPKMFYL